MADIRATENTIAQGGATGPVDASIAQPSVGEAAAQPADGVISSEPAKLDTKDGANKITKPAAKTSGTSDQKKGPGNLLSKLMFWKKDKKAQA